MNQTHSGVSASDTRIHAIQNIALKIRRFMIRDHTARPFAELRDPSRFRGCISFALTPRASSSLRAWRVGHGRQG